MFLETVLFTQTCFLKNTSSQYTALEQFERPLFDATVISLSIGNLPRPQVWDVWCDVVRWIGSGFDLDHR